MKQHSNIVGKKSVTHNIQLERLQTLPQCLREQSRNQMLQFQAHQLENLYQNFTGFSATRKKLKDPHLIEHHLQRNRDRIERAKLVMEMKLRQAEEMIKNLKVSQVNKRIIYQNKRQLLAREVESLGKHSTNYNTWSEREPANSTLL